MTAEVNNYNSESMLDFPYIEPFLLIILYKNSHFLASLTLTKQNTKLKIMRKQDISRGGV